MTRRMWLHVIVDGLNHWTCPIRSCWSLALCLYDSEMLMWEDGLFGTKPTLRSARRTARKIKEFRRVRVTHV